MNNYGPYQFPEKLIPLMIAMRWRTGRCPLWRWDAVRDWLFVDDHCRGILSVLKRAARARSTTLVAIGRCRTWKWYTRFSRLPGSPSRLIQYVTDRPGHDRRYALPAKS